MSAKEENITRKLDRWFKKEKKGEQEVQDMLTLKSGGKVAKEKVSSF